jgi:hypothetical protein
MLAIHASTARPVARATPRANARNLAARTSRTLADVDPDRRRG